MTKKRRSPVPDVWSTVPWLLSHRIDGHRRYPIDGTEPARQLPAHPSPNERTAAAIAAGERDKQESEDREE